MVIPKITPNDIEREVPADTFLVSKTDKKGIITYANTVFIEISGYTEEELVGSPHNIVRHPDMPRTVFKLLWDTIQKGEEFWGYIKNLAKDGSYYWVFARVTPSYSREKEIIGYQSDRRRARKDAVEKISQIYKKMLEAERTGGIEAGLAIINDILKKEGKEYVEFILSI